MLEEGKVEVLTTADVVKVIVVGMMNTLALIFGFEDLSAFGSSVAGSGSFVEIKGQALALEGNAFFLARQHVGVLQTENGSGPIRAAGLHGEPSGFLDLTLVVWK